MPPPVGPSYRIAGAKGCFSPHVLLRCTGSSVVNAIPFAVVSAVYTVLLHQYRTCQLWPSACPADDLLFIHPYPLQGILILSGLGLVFRVNQSLSRYWEARTGMQNASSKWMDGIVMAVSMDDETSVGPGKLQESHRQFSNAAVHLGSLLHGVALHTLRGDTSLDTLCPRCFSDGTGSGDTHSRCQSLASLQTGSPPAKVESSRLSWRQMDYDPSHKSRLLRSRAQLRLRSPLAKQTAQAEAFAERNAVEMLGGPTEGERARLVPSEQRVAMVSGWLMRLLVRRRRRGGISHDAPIVSRIYQVISDGNMHFYAALKVSDTPFPFPYAQLNGIICAVNFALWPVVVADKTANIYLAAAVSFCYTCLYFSMHDVARDLEEPFSSELGMWLGANRLHAPFMQQEFDDRLLAGCGVSASGLLVPPAEGGEIMISDQDAETLYSDMVDDALGESAPPPQHYSCSWLRTKRFKRVVPTPYRRSSRASSPPKSPSPTEDTKVSSFDTATPRNA